ncbi:hypothetical protein CC1G_07585 [Coprinopsis cinerea okayama7|uniref:Peptidase A1 domain-containing protein n=1 Tax=Coprinopsis cinerea (strain Okayama-7 / 130 / ATCC MYA-4618 / FGSC 9003) TaxID=240176 RepID=A8NUP5_COPC7|nr:hypothetical protein CC1G_07585 [Coprinopsis cinerea okayama7\|eukprot:XP_001836502.2 hypothetical protein CC1G_07585 [Coprinopsis cinerea okayama7\
MAAAAILSSGWLFLQASASSHPRLVPRSDLATLPIVNTPTLHARDFDGNPNTAAGLAQVSISSDRQSYTTIIKIGDINFRVALDTASADLWVVSSDCDTKECEKVPRFPLAYQSQTFREINGNETTFEAGYADGTAASGFLAKERIALHDIVLDDQVFGLVSQSNLSFVDQTSGLLGLGFPRLSSFPNVTNVAPFFPRLAQKGMLEYPLFAFSLTRNNTGSLALGAIDASVVKNVSLIAWNQVASFPPFAETESDVGEPGYLQWAIPLAEVYVNGTALEINPVFPERNEGRVLALVDIGATGIYGPAQEVSKIFAMIDGSRIVDADGQWVIPCDTDVPITFTFGSQNYTLLPEDYMIGPALGNPNLCLSWPRAHPPHSDAIDWQFGAAFLRTVYSIFSYGIDTKEPPLIGFYSIRNETLLANTTQPPEELASFFSAHSATVPTTLPNVLLPTPSYSSPPYAFNSSVPAPLGAIVTSDLANSTYSALFGIHTTFNASAIPTISVNQTLITQTFTDEAGQLTVSTSTVEIETAPTLGVPPGWSSSATRQGLDSFWTFYAFFPTWTLAFLFYCIGDLVS